jgi:uncharacterized protein
MQAVEAHPVSARTLRPVPPTVPAAASRAGQRLPEFLLIAFAFTWACWLSTARIPPGRLHWALSTLGQFGPLLAAVVVTARESGRAGLGEMFGRMLKWRFSPKWLVIALLLPPLTYYAAIGAKAYFTGESPQLKGYRVSYDVLINFFVILLIGGPLGEEPGWRGYAMRPLRERYGKNGGVAVLGVIWACWHLPVWWRAGEFPLGVIGLAVLGMVAISFAFAWLSDRTGGSVLPSLILHASFNTFFVVLPMEWAYAWWVAVAWVVAAGILWTGRTRSDTFGVHTEGWRPF